MVKLTNDYPYREEQVVYVREPTGEVEDQGRFHVSSAEDYDSLHDFTAKIYDYAKEHADDLPVSSEDKIPAFQLLPRNQFIAATIKRLLMTAQNKDGSFPETHQIDCAKIQSRLLLVNSSSWATRAGGVPSRKQALSLFPEARSSKS